MVKEGRLEDLIAVEHQTELILENADAALVAQIRQLVDADPAAQWVRSGKPRTTLERLFLEHTQKEKI
jgi:ABC-2 type transport system ATP-binding protein